MHMLSRFSTLILLILNLAFCSTSCFARWASYDDAALETEFYKTHKKINADGSSEMLIHEKIKILKEGGREILSGRRFYYNAVSEEFKIIEAKTINGSSVTHTPKDKIEDSALASLGNGFDEKKQILVSYPNLQVGSVVETKYRIKKNNSPVKGFFAENWFFGQNSYSKNTELKIESAIDLNLKINDPYKSLKINNYKKDATQFIEITTTKPIYEAVINEPAGSIVDINKITWVSLSSIKKIEDIAIKLTKGYEDVITQKLPPSFKKIVDGLQSKENINLKETDIINIVTSSLADNIQYMGDWRSIKGRFYPRSLETIAKSRIGDCKDFSASTAAMMRALGFKADAVLVLRGEHNRSNTDTLPSLYDFNHAMVRVLSKDNEKTYWIDPTNTQSMAGYIFPDIAGKMALVLDQKNISHEQIPTVDPANNTTMVTHNIKLDMKNNIIFYSGDAIAKDQAARIFTGARLYLSEKYIKDLLFESINGSYIPEQDREYMNIPDLSSRIVQDIKFSFAYKKPRGMFLTNMGKGLEIGFNNIVKTVESIRDDQVGDMILYPETEIKKYLISGGKAKKIAKLNYQINDDWVDISRKFSKVKGGKIQMLQKIVIKKDIMKNEYFKSVEYKNLKDSLQKDFDKVRLIFSNS